MDQTEITQGNRRTFDPRKLFERESSTHSGLTDKTEDSANNDGFGDNPDILQFDAGSYSSGIDSRSGIAEIPSGSESIFGSRKSQGKLPQVPLEDALSSLDLNDDGPLDIVQSSGRTSVQQLAKENEKVNNEYEQFVAICLLSTYFEVC